MNFDEMVSLLRGLPRTAVVIAAEDNGAPEASWGDAFATYEPEADAGRKQHFPFATVVQRDVPGFDEVSLLDRPGVYRLNLSVGREVIAERSASELAPDVADHWFPHPYYATQGWISIVSPSDQRREEVEGLARLAHERARARIHR